MIKKKSNSFIDELTTCWRTSNSNKTMY